MVGTLYKTFRVTIWQHLMLQDTCVGPAIWQMGRPMATWKDRLNPRSKMHPLDPDGIETDSGVKISGDFIDSTVACGLYMKLWEAYKSNLDSFAVGEIVRKHQREMDAREWAKMTPEERREEENTPGLWLRRLRRKRPMCCNFALINITCRLLGVDEGLRRLGWDGTEGSVSPYVDDETLFSSDILRVDEIVDLVLVAAPNKPTSIFTTHEQIEIAMGYVKSEIVNMVQENKKQAVTAGAESENEVEEGTDEDSSEEEEPSQKKQKAEVYELLSSDSSCYR